MIIVLATLTLITSTITMMLAAIVAKRQRDKTVRESLEESLTQLKRPRGWRIRGLWISALRQVDRWVIPHKDELESRNRD